MAKTDFTYACGCAGWTDLRGPQKSRDWQLQRLEGDLCPTCWGKARVEESRAEGAEAVAKVAASGTVWPELTGSEKQVAWATQIRARAIVWCTEQKGPMEEHVLGSARASMVRALASIDRAAWFCDRARVSAEMLHEAALADLACRDLRGWTNTVAADAARMLAGVLEARAGTDAEQDDARTLRSVQRRVGHISGRICHAAHVTRSHRDPPPPKDTFLHETLWPVFVVELRRELAGRGVEVDTTGWEDEPHEELRP